VAEKKGIFWVTSFPLLLPFFSFGIALKQSIERSKV